MPELCQRGRGHGSSAIITICWVGGGGGGGGGGHGSSAMLITIGVRGRFGSSVLVIFSAILRLSRNSTIESDGGNRSTRRKPPPNPSHWQLSQMPRQG